MPAGPSTIAPVGEKTLGVEHGASGNIVHVGVGETRGEELSPGRATEIHVGLGTVAAKNDGLRADALDLRRDLFGHLEGVHRNVRPDRSNHRSGACRQCAKVADRSPKHPGDNAPPPRVDGGHLPYRGVGEQDGHAIGGTNRARNPLGATQDRVRLDAQDLMG